MKMILNLTRYIFIILLCLDLTIYISTDIIKEPIFNIAMSQKGEDVIFFLETQKNNPRWNEKRDAIYISESDEFINIGVAKAQRSNYLVSAIWGSRYIYLPKNDYYQVSKVTGNINTVENDYLANGGLFISQVGILKSEEVFYVGYTRNEAHLAEHEFNFIKKIYFDNGTFGWIFICNEEIGHNSSGGIYVLQ